MDEDFKASAGSQSRSANPDHQADGRALEILNRYAAGKISLRQAARSGIDAKQADGYAVVEAIPR